MLIVSTAAFASAQTGSRDTTRSKYPTGRVKISIDENGISVQGHVQTGKHDSDSWVEINGDRHLREKGKDIVRFGEGVVVKHDEVVHGDLVVFGGDATIEGRVTGNVAVIGGNIRARDGSEIRGDAVVIGGELDEDDNAMIRGERVLIGNWNGHIHFNWGHGGLPEFLLPLFLFIKIILALIVVLFLRERVERADRHLSAGYARGFGVGLLGFFVGMMAILFVSIPLVITIIGIPLAVLLWVSCVGVFLIAWTAFVHALGRLVATRFAMSTRNPVAWVLIGATIVTLPDIISAGASVFHLGPLSVAFGLLGCIVRCFAYLAGLGALVLSRFGTRSLPDATGPVAAATTPV